MVGCVTERSDGSGRRARRTGHGAESGTPARRRADRRENLWGRNRWIAGSSTLRPPVKLPKAGSSRRSASAAKQRRAKLRRLVCRRALGWRWPTISPTSPVGAWRSTRPSTASSATTAPPSASGSHRVVVAGDPDPAPLPGHAAQPVEQVGRQLARTAAIVEAVAQAHHRVRAAAARSAPPAGPAWRGCRRAAAGCRAGRRPLPFSRCRSATISMA